MEVMMDILGASGEWTAQPCVQDRPAAAPFDGVLAAVIAGEETRLPVSAQAAPGELTDPVQPRPQATAGDALAAALAAAAAAPVPAVASQPLDGEPDLAAQATTADDTADPPDQEPPLGGVRARVRAGWEIAPGHARRQAVDEPPGRGVTTRPSAIPAFVRELVAARTPAMARESVPADGPSAPAPMPDVGQSMAEVPAAVEIRTDSTGPDHTTGQTTADIPAVTASQTPATAHSAPPQTVDTAQDSIVDRSVIETAAPDVRPAVEHAAPRAEGSDLAAARAGSNPVPAQAASTLSGQGTQPAVETIVDAAPVSPPAGSQDAAQDTPEQGADERQQQAAPVPPAHGRDHKLGTDDGGHGVGRARQGSPTNRVDPQPDHGADAVKCAANCPVRPEPQNQPEIVAVPREPVSIERLPDELVTVARSAQTDGRAEVELRLDPPELGRVIVKMTAEQGRLKTEFTVVTDAARQLVSDQISRLRTDLTTAGYEVGDVTVSLDNRGRQPEGQRQRPEGGRGRVRAGSPSAAYSQARIMRPDSSFEFVA